MSDGSSQLLRVLGSALIRCVPFCHPVVTSQDSQGVPRAKWSLYKIAPELNIQRLQNARDSPVWREIKTTLHGPGSIATILFLRQQRLKNR